MTAGGGGAMCCAMKKIDPTWFAFLAMTFVVVGLTGVFATFATPLPLYRALSRDAADATLRRSRF